MQFELDADQKTPYTALLTTYLVIFSFCPLALCFHFHFHLLVVTLSQVSWGIRLKGLATMGARKRCARSHTMVKLSLSTFLCCASCWSITMSFDCIPYASFFPVGSNSKPFHRFAITDSHRHAINLGHPFCFCIKVLSYISYAVIVFIKDVEACPRVRYLLDAYTFELAPYWKNHPVSLVQ